MDNVCLGRVHKPQTANAFYTYALGGGPTTVKPCPNTFLVKKKYGRSQNHLQPKLTRDELGFDIFCQTEKDNSPALSIKDITFIRIMEHELRKDESGSWVVPLPFKSLRCHLPDNKAQAMSRISSLRRTLEKKPKMREHFLSFMRKMLVNGHNEVAPTPTEGEEQ